MLQHRVLILQLILHFNDQLPQAAILADRRLLLGQPYKASFQILIHLPANLILKPLVSILSQVIFNLRLATKRHYR